MRNKAKLNLVKKIKSKQAGNMSFWVEIFFERLCTFSAGRLNAQLNRL